MKIYDWPNPPAAIASIVFLVLAIVGWNRLLYKLQHSERLMSPAAFLFCLLGLFLSMVASVAFFFWWASHTRAP